jgi:hypothetical protein
MTDGRSPCIGCRRENKSKKRCATKCERRIAFVERLEFWGEVLGETIAYRLPHPFTIPHNDKALSSWDVI